MNFGRSKLGQNLKYVPNRLIMVIYYTFRGKESKKNYCMLRSMDDLLLHSDSFIETLHIKRTKF